MRKLVIASLVGAVLLWLAHGYYNRQPETIAQELIGNYRYEEALAVLDREIKEHRARASAHALKASVLAVLGDQASARRELAEAKLLAPDDVAITFSRIHTLALLEAYDESLALCDAMLATRPASASLWATTAAVLAGQGRYEQALRASNRAIDEEATFSPNYAQMLAQRAVLKRQTKDVACALADLDQALDLNKSLVGARLQRGITLVVSGRPDEAKQEFVQYLKLRPGGEGYVRRSVAMAVEGKIATVVEDIRMMRTFLPQKTEAALSAEPVKPLATPATAAKTPGAGPESHDRRENDARGAMLAFFRRPLGKPWHVASIIGFGLIFTGLWALGRDVKQLGKGPNWSSQRLRTLFAKIQVRRALSLGMVLYLGWALFAGVQVVTYWGLAAGMLFLETLSFAGEARKEIGSMRG